MGNAIHTYIHYIHYPTQPYPTLLCPTKPQSPCIGSFAHQGYRNTQKTQHAAPFWNFHWFIKAYGHIVPSPSGHSLKISIKSLWNTELHFFLFFSHAGHYGSINTENKQRSLRLVWTTKSPIISLGKFTHRQRVGLDVLVSPYN